MPNYQLHRTGDNDLLDEVSSDIYGINKTLGITATKAFFYDTSLDYDGGAWRYKTDHTSWAKEDRSTGVYLGALADETAARVAGGTTGDYYYATGAAAFYELSAGSGQALTYRGGSQKFPATALITLEDLASLDRVTIWDTSDGSMWKVLSINNEIADVSMTNGQLSIAQDSAGVIVWSFLDETLVRYLLNIKQSQPWASAVTGSSFVSITGSLGLVGQATNCITQTVLPNAPIIPETGLPLVTTVVGTDGGLTILNGPNVAGGPPVEGNAVDITHSASTLISHVVFREDGALVYGTDTGGVTSRYIHVRHNLPPTDQSEGNPWVKGNSDEHYVGTLGFGDITLSDNVGFLAITENSFARTAAVNFIQPNRVTPSEGSQVIMKETSISPVVTGGTLGAWIASTSTTAATTSDPDVSPNENHLDITGTLTRTAVATGSDLVGYSGFSASNYGLVPASVTSGITTGDFTETVWVKGTDTFFCVTAGATNTSTGMQWGLNGGAGTSAPQVLIAGTNAITVADTAEAEPIISDNWCMMWVRRSGTTVDFGVNNTVVASGTSSGSIHDAAGNLVGTNSDNSITADLLSFSLLSITDRALTAEQIATKYNIERFWFEEDAVVTLDSSVVRDVAFDKALNRYHVLTDTGHSVFDARSFTRLEYTAGDWDFIAVDDGRVVKG